jgi:hypothetical protein
MMSRLPTKDEAEKSASLLRDLQKGIDDLDAGRSSDAAEVFARVLKRIDSIDGTA